MRLRFPIVFRVLVICIATVLLSCGRAPLPTPALLPTDASPTETPIPTVPPQPTMPPTATPSPVAQWIEEGDAALRQSRFKEAEEAYRRAIAAAPDYAPAYVALSRLCWWSAGRNQEGLEHAQKAVELAPDDALAQAALALAYVDTNQDEKALEAAKRASELDDASAEALVALSTAYRDNREYDLALEAAERAVSLAPEMAHGYAALGSVYRATADFGRARAAYEKAIALEPSFAPWHVSLAYNWQAMGRRALAEEAVQAALKLDPDSLPALVELAYLRLLQNDYAEAEPLIDRAIVLAPDSAIPYVTKGTLYLYQDKPDEAMAEFRQALEKEEKDSDAQAGITEVFAMRQECDSAAREAQKIEEWYPGSIEGAMTQGYAKLCAGDATKALEYFRSAIKRDPYDYGGHRGMARAYAVQERWEEAMASQVEALRLMPGNADLHTDLASAFRGQSQMDAERSELDTALRVDPDSTSAHIGLASLSLVQDEPVQAEEQIRRALQFKPEDPFSRRILGIALTNQGKAAEATQVLEELAADEPEDAGAHWFLAFLYRDAGRYADAAKELKTYKGLTGNTEMDGMIEWLEQGYKIAEKQFIQTLQPGLKSYLGRTVKMRVDQSKEGGRTLVVILQAAANETEEDVFPDVITSLLGMASLAPRLDPPASEGIAILVQKGGRTLYTARLELAEAIALGDGRVLSDKLGEYVEFARPLGSQASRSLSKIRSDTEAIRELKAGKAVPFSSIDAETLRANLQKELAEEEALESVKEDQALLGLLGIIEPETDLGQMYVDMLAEQVAGYYDTDEAAMFVRKQQEQSAQDQMVVAHEYAHALQDQQFGLDDEARPEMTDDEDLAFDALVEGDATLTMVQYADDHIPAADRWASIERASGLEDEALERTPEFIQQVELFPYAAGYTFVAALHGQGGWEAVNEAYAKPPRSTEQVLHPERYREGDEPVAVELPDVAAALGGEWKTRKSDVMGELGLRMALATHLGMAAAMRASEGWGGDRYTLLQQGEGGAYALVMRSAWDDEEEAQQFWDLFQTSMLHRPEYTEKVDALVGPVDTHRWLAEGSCVIAKQLDEAVLLIYAQDEATATALLDAFERS